MIRAWELAEMKRLEEQEAPGTLGGLTVPTTVSISTTSEASTMSFHEVFEPMRCIPNRTPPKRFYRTFWRSISWRVLEHERKAVIAQVKTQTS